MIKGKIYLWSMFVICQVCIYTGHIDAACMFIVGMVCADVLAHESEKSNKALIEALKRL